MPTNLRHRAAVARKLDADGDTIAAHGPIDPERSMVITRVPPPPGYDHDAPDDDGPVALAAPPTADVEPPPPPLPPVPAALTFEEYTAALADAQRPMAGLNAARAAAEAGIAELNSKQPDDIAEEDIDRRLDLRRELMRIDLAELGVCRKLAAIDPRPAMTEARRKEQAAAEAVPKVVARVRADMIAIGFPLDRLSDFPVGSQMPTLLNAALRGHPAVRQAHADAEASRNAVGRLTPHTAGLGDRIARLEQSIRKAARVGD